MHSNSKQKGMNGSPSRQPILAEDSSEIRHISKLGMKGWDTNHDDRLLNDPFDVPDIRVEAR